MPGQRLAPRAERPPLIWLGTNTCGGESISLLNARDPGYDDLLTALVSSRYEYMTMSAQGRMATRVLEDIPTRYPGGYLLIVEGSIPVKAGGMFSVVGWRKGKPITALSAVRRLGREAAHVVAVGTCASFGGPYSASPNPTGCLPVQAVLDRPVINVPGCPANPSWIMGTIAHLVYRGRPKVDNLGRPLMFYRRTVHNLCQRRDYFDNSIFAAKPGDPGCLYRIGCKGPVTLADCPERQWNSEHVSWPVKAGAPCIGCTGPEFPDGSSPFFEHVPDVSLPGVRVAGHRVGGAVLALTALGIGAHLLANVITGRLARVYAQGFSRGFGGALRGLVAKLHDRIVRARE